MKEPDWTTCNEEQLWRYVAWHLEGAGIRSVLVGGAVVSIYTEGLYRSGDLDMVPDDLGRDRLPEVLARIGFEPTRSRYFKHPACAHLYLEFPRGPVEIGEQFPVTPDQIEVEGRTLRLLSPTDSVKGTGWRAIFIGRRGRTSTKRCSFAAGNASGCIWMRCGPGARSRVASPPLES